MVPMGNRVIRIAQVAVPADRDGGRLEGMAAPLPEVEPGGERLTRRTPVEPLS